MAGYIRPAYTLGSSWFYDTEGYLANDTIVASPHTCVLNMAWGFNPNATARYLWLCNSGPAGSLGNNVVVYMPPTAEFSIAFDDAGLYFNGPSLVFGVSSTGDTYTASADTIRLSAMGRYT